MCLDTYRHEGCRRHTLASSAAATTSRAVRMTASLPSTSLRTRVGDGPILDGGMLPELCIARWGREPEREDAFGDLVHRIPQLRVLLLDHEVE